MVALDHRGHGRGIRSRRPFHLEDCADDVAALTRELRLGPVTAVGYSMGGPIAQLLWRRHPEVVDGLVLCATAARFSDRAEFNGPVGLLGYGMAVAMSGVPAGVRRQGLESGDAQPATRTSAVAAWAIEEWERNDPAALLQAGLCPGPLRLHPLDRCGRRAHLGRGDHSRLVRVTRPTMAVGPVDPRRPGLPRRRQPSGVRRAGPALRPGVAGGVPRRSAR